MLSRFDLSIFYILNHELANSIFDYLFIIISESRVFTMLVIILVLAAYWKGDIRLKLAIALAVICVALADPTTHYILKKFFARLRPCHSLDDVRLLVGCGGLYGFPSNHAVNSFAIAAVLSFFYRRLTSLLVALAIIVGLSRVYLGKHYPSDVLAGAILGVLAAAFVIYLARWLVLRLLRTGVRETNLSKIREILFERCDEKRTDHN